MVLVGSGRVLVRFWWGSGEFWRDSGGFWWVLVGFWLVLVFVVVSGGF